MKLSQAEPIGSLEEVRAHLQYAIGLELATIPAYLSALYTIEEGENTAAFEVIQSVVLEEMLHMTLAANVLNGIGGAPSPDPVPGTGLGSPVPVYPTKIPFIDRIPMVHLQRFSPEALDIFIEIEQPSESDGAGGGDDQYDSIGAFYEAIETALNDVVTDETFEEARRTRAGCQVPAKEYYGGAGSIIEVYDRQSALAALQEIVAEGEGVSEDVLGQTISEHLAAGAESPGAVEVGYSVEDGDELAYGWKMYSHYARFREIAWGRRYRPDQLVSEEPAGDVLPVDWAAVLPMATDPRAEEYAGTQAWEPMVACNLAYTALVDTLYRGFNGEPEAVARAVPMMYDLKERAVALMRTPSPHDPFVHLGPGFEYLFPDARERPEIAAIASRAGVPA